jgi:hypothetical protein
VEGRKTSNDTKPAETAGRISNDVGEYSVPPRRVWMDAIEKAPRKKCSHRRRMARPASLYRGI